MAPRRNQKANSEEVEFESCLSTRLVHWREPQKSAIALGVGLVILFCTCRFSVISVVAYTLLAAVCSAFGFRVYKLVMSKVNKAEEGHPFQELLDLPLPENLSDREKAHQFGESVFANLLKFVKKFRSIVLIEDLIESAKFIVIMWFATYIGAWFNGFTLVILLWIGLFTVPKIYLTYKREINEQLEKISALFGQVQNKAPAQVGKDD